MSTLTPQSAAFYRDNFDIDEGLPAEPHTLANRGAVAAGILQQQHNDKYNAGLITKEEWRAGNREIEKFPDKLVAKEPEAIKLAGQLWYENVALPTIASEQSQSSFGGGQSSQPSQPESIPSAFIEAAKNRAPGSSPRPQTGGGGIVGGAGVVDLGSGTQGNANGLIFNAGNLLTPPAYGFNPAGGLIASSNPQLVNLGAARVRYPGNF